MWSELHARPWWEAGSLEECGLGVAATPACGPQSSAAFLPSFVIPHPQHILYCIVDSECKSRDVLQSYFDLLGELMKFNVDAFKRFNKYINTDAKVRLTGRCGVCSIVQKLPWSPCPHQSLVLVLNWRLLVLGSQWTALSRQLLASLCWALKCQPLVSRCDGWERVGYENGSVWWVP